MLYLHIPFCKQACYYCNFHFSTSLKRKDELLQALAKELLLRKYESQNPITSIYFGGGTPSLLHIDELNFLLDTIYQNYQVVNRPEITLEANPDDLNLAKIRALSKSRINRLSIGIQSFFDEDLKFMNRTHNATQALNCLENAVSHFDNITVDLIYGIPNLTNQKWGENLLKVFNLGVKHVSAYALTVEPKTALANFINSGKYPPVDEALALEQFNHLVAETKKHDFIHYEISNFGKEGYFSKHNTAYWQGKNYLGIGPSAHSFNGSARSWNVSNNARYLIAIANNELPSETEILTINNRFNETIMMGLRTIWGIDLKTIETQFGLEYHKRLLKQAQKHLSQGTLELINTENSKAATLKITSKGLFLADGIAADLFVV
ncbi:MAG: coproporphyrinogen III oxidase [Flavobacteriales bacterium CG_4_8_14_3_um_filter_35_10]|nr:radical SAM family heme chaperone HemW [Zetaproteobacteria bacterium]PIX07588.1 MAG: coproporphyrinogen III oxidase [Flavobacteriales bacterium CG_4_8_14_3_um_filter_35_10]